MVIRYFCDDFVDDIERGAIKDALFVMMATFPGITITKEENVVANACVVKSKTIHKVGHIQLDVRSLRDILEQNNDGTTIDIMFTGIDLGAKELNFCFGLAGDRTIAQSAYRYRGLPRAERELAIKAVVYHELGHILGCASDLRRANTVRDLGNHCTVDGCIMRQGHDLDEWLDHAKRAKAKHRIFCPQCMIEAKRGVARL